MLIRFLAFLIGAACLFGANQGRLFYSKSFPGSVPEYTEIRLDPSGSCEYREAADDQDPVKFQLTAAETSAIFSLAEKLGYFNRPLESGLKVAKTGEKTFRWEDGSTRNEVKFNYSEDLDTQKLLDWFERIAETERILIELQKNARFDKLGVNKILLYLQSASDHGRLVGADQFLPTLDRIAKNASYINLARNRAATLAETFRNAKTRSE